MGEKKKVRVLACLQKKWDPCGNRGSCSEKKKEISIKMLKLRSLTKKSLGGRRAYI